MNIFEYATRNKLRFDTSKGALTVEDLWDLPLTSNTGKVCLNDIAIGLHKQIRETAEVVSFVDTSTAQDPSLQIRFDIVKHVIDARKKENEEAATAKQRSELKQQILAALARKRENALETASEEELLAKLSSL